MKYPNVKYKIGKIQKIGLEAYTVKVRVGKWPYYYWNYIYYDSFNGTVRLVRWDKEYQSKEGALKALNMYQQYGEIGREEKVIESN